MLSLAALLRYYPYGIQFPSALCLWKILSLCVDGFFFYLPVQGPANPCLPQLTTDLLKHDDTGSA